MLEAMTRRPKLLTMAAVLPLLVAGCGSAPQKSPPTGVDGLEIPTPSADPGDFVEGIDNPYLPLRPGSRWVYKSRNLDQQTTTVTVTGDTREVQGVTTTVVHDVVKDPDGTVVEETVDWFAERGVLVAPGDFYGVRGARHVRVALTASNERVEAGAGRIAA